MDHLASPESIESAHESRGEKQCVAEGKKEDGVLWIEGKNP
jgi:hypothetical protein